MTRQLDPIGGQLRRVRDSLGLALADVEGKSAGRWKAAAVGSWERGDRNPTVRAARELLTFLGGFRIEVLGPDDIVVPAADADAGTSYVENLVAYGPGLTDRIPCRSKERAESIAALMPGARVGYRTHVVGDVQFYDDDTPGGVR